MKKQRINTMRAGGRLRGALRGTRLLTLVAILLGMLVFSASTVLAKDVVARGNGNFLEDANTWTLYDDGELKLESKGDSWINMTFSGLPWTTYGPEGDVNLSDQIKTLVVGEGIKNLYLASYDNASYDNLVRIELPESIEVIYIDGGCPSLQEVRIQDDVKLSDLYLNVSHSSPWLEKIKAGKPYAVFHGVLFDGRECKGEVVIPEEVTSISNNAFAGAEELTSVVFPDNIQKIPFHAFQGCASLSSVRFPEELTDIEDSAFEGCVSLKTVAFPKKLASIGGGVFSGCYLLESVQAPEDIELKSVEDDAFSDTKWIKKCMDAGEPARLGSVLVSGYFLKGGVVIPEGIRGISESAFYGSALEQITFPKSLEWIGDEAFYHCTNLKSVHLPAGLTSIGWGVFSDCSKLEKVTWEDGLHLNYREVGDAIFSGTAWEKQSLANHEMMILGDYAYDGRACEGEVTIPEGVRTIGYSAFYDADQITAVHLPDSLEIIGDYAFDSAVKLAKLHIPKNVTTIGYYALATFMDDWEDDQVVFNDDCLINLTVDPANPVYTSVNGFLCERESGEMVRNVYWEQVDFLGLLYQNFLGRIPDRGGLINWWKLLGRQQVSGQKTVANFVHSQEFQSNPLGNEAFVTALYKTIFDREPDEAGLSAWTSVLDRGCTRDKVLAGLLNSAEMEAKCVHLNILSEKYVCKALVDIYTQVTFFVSRLYQNCLGRRFDEGGLTNWVTALVNGGKTGRQVAESFFFSQEMKNKNLSDEEYVRAAYLTLLDREADASGLAAWVKVLGETGDRSKIVQGFTGSAEFGKLCESYGIKR